MTTAVVFVSVVIVLLLVFLYLSWYFLYTRLPLHYGNLIGQLFIIMEAKH